MRIGTHNSMTYLPLKNWWMYPFNWIAKCQSKSLYTQYTDYKVRDFDFRIRFDKHQDPYFCHGIIKYKGNVEDYLKYLNQKEPCCIRLILETSKEDKYQERLFIDFVKYIIQKYPNITFWQFTAKHNWKVLYESPFKESYYDQYISSMNSKWCIFPRLFAKRNNKKATTDKELMLLDFVEYLK